MPISQEDKQVIFVAKARGHSIAGFVKEKKTGGVIDIPGESINFNDHILSTSDKKVIKFVRDSYRFATDVKEFDNIDDAMRYRAMLEKKAEVNSSGKIGTDYTEDVAYKGQPAEGVAANAVGINRE